MEAPALFACRKDESLFRHDAAKAFLSGVAFAAKHGKVGTVEWVLIEVVRREITGHARKTFSLIKIQQCVHSFSESTEKARYF